MKQAIGEGSWVGQGGQVSAGNDEDVRVEAVACNASLKFEREEPIACRCDDTQRELRPPVKAARLAEHRVRLLTWVHRACLQNLPGHVMQEIRLRVELRAVAAGGRGGRARMDCAGVLPTNPGRARRAGGSSHSRTRAYGSRPARRPAGR